MGVTQPINGIFFSVGELLVDFITGAQFTVGDIPVGIAAYRWFAMDIEREDYPNLKAWYDRLTQRPAFREHIMQPLA